MIFEKSNLVQIMAWPSWCRETGVDLQTGNKWRKRGWIKPSIVINNRLYVSAGDNAEFFKRASAGEFKGENDPSGHLFKVKE